MQLPIRQVCQMAFVLLLLACNNQRQDDQGSNMNEEGGAISDMIRNPVSADNPQDTSSLARITFDETVFDFDTIAEGSIVEHSFKFKNTGKSPLVINNARSSCGCTVPEWPKDPIPAGGKGEILVRFNSTDKTGSQNKPITIFANSYPQQTVIRIRGFVTK